jgi:hypothetical protein
MTTPDDLYWDYRALAVDLPDGTSVAGIDVHGYRNAADYAWKTPDGKDGIGGGNKPGPGTISSQFDIDKGLDVAYAALRNKIRQYGTSLGTNMYRIDFPLPGVAVGARQADIVTLWPDMGRPYFGKGDPDLVAEALRLAAAFGLVEPTRAAMQAYADKYLGVDCSGFAGNYLVRLGLSEKWLDTAAIDFAPPANRLTRLEQIKTGTMVVWQNGNHVAVVDRIIMVERKADGTASAVNCWVAESTADRMEADGPASGLNYTPYFFISEGTNKPITALRCLAKSQGGASSPKVWTFGTYSPKVWLANLC